MKSRILFLLFAASCVGPVSAATPPLPRTDAPTQIAGTPDSALNGGDALPPDASMPAEDEYRIGANDLLEISVFQVKELDRSVRVNSRGMITLPLIGAVQAAGASATELEKRVADKLKEKYLQDPQVSIFIKEFTSQRVTIEGQVEKAGIYPMTGRTTLLQAIALAGGMKDLGESASVRVFRLEAGGTRKMQLVDLEQVRNGVITDPPVKNNDIVVVEKSASRAMIRTITDTLRGFITFGGL